MKNNKNTNLLALVFALFSFCAFTQKNSSTENDASQSKIQERAERRLIKPGTHILSLLPSNNQYPLIIHDPSVLLKRETTRGFNKHLTFAIDALYLNYEYALPKNFFVESGFKYLKHWTYLETNDWIIKYGGFRKDFRSTFSTLSFNFGGGYRFVGENNLRFFDVHAGFSLGITDNPVGNGGSFSASKPYEDSNGDQGIMSYSWIYRISSRYYYGFYLGLSKDIRVTKNLYVTARYHYQFGKNSELTEHLINYDLPTLDINNTVRASNTAKGQMYALGLRWFFDK